MVFIKRMRKKGKCGHMVASFFSWFANKVFMHIVRPRYVKRGVRFISQYRNIYTTRLHGLILSHLLGKNIFIVSNNNGKLENYYNSWLQDCENIKIVNC